MPASLKSLPDKPLSPVDFLANSRIFPADFWLTPLKSAGKGKLRTANNRNAQVSPVTLVQMLRRLPPLAALLDVAKQVRVVLPRLPLRQPPQVRVVQHRLQPAKV